MTLVLGMDVIWGKAERSISSRSPNSLSVKRYGVFMIRNTNSRHYDEQHKILICQPNFSALCLTFWHVIRKALVEAHFAAHFLFSLSFPCFLAKTSSGFVLKPQQIRQFYKTKTTQRQVSVRLILMRSNSELQILSFRSEKRIGLLTQSDSAKSDGT